VALISLAFQEEGSMDHFEQVSQVNTDCRDHGVVCKQGAAERTGVAFILLMSHLAATGDPGNHIAIALIGGLMGKLVAWNNGQVGFPLA
jgi:hypothetical protein